MKNVVAFCKPYTLVLTLFAGSTLYFLITNFSAFWFSLKTVLASGTLIQIAKSQYFIAGAIIGFVIMLILHIAHGSGDKQKIVVIIRHGVMLLILAIWSTLLIDTLYIASPIERIIFWSNKLMQFDKSIFGVYPAFFMYAHYSALIEKLIITVYSAIPLTVGLWTGFLILTQKTDELKKWLVSVFTAMAICIPIWIAVPALQPYSVFVMNTFNQKIPADIQNEIIKGPPSEFLFKNVTLYENLWNDPRHIRYSVSNFPSMHVLWGFLLLFSVHRTFRSKWVMRGLLLICIANLLGAVYLLQHFGVDVLASFIVLGVIHLTQRTKKTI